MRVVRDTWINVPLPTLSWQFLNTTMLSIPERNPVIEINKPGNLDPDQREGKNPCTEIQMILLYCHETNLE
ncbi:MAG: hypothetical protein BWY82_01265 [Verrucomicrobia bacterium ADurb.Bin474]|nr:MAG: hypothetical protein BWY82_01265 [Verrucomicrobia bacterium ADurb.Bin474]